MPERGARAENIHVCRQLREHQEDRAQGWPQALREREKRESPGPNRIRKTPPTLVLEEECMGQRRPSVAAWHLALLLAVTIGLVPPLTTPAFAQSAGSTIHGTVKDESGGAV